MLIEDKLAEDGFEKRHFDYIIVGAGAAGSALAAALTDDATCSVLLIEAGKYFGRVDQYPELLRHAHKYTFSLAPGKVFPSAQYNKFTWAYEGRLNEFLKARIVRGRVVGGSSAVNGAHFIRGRPSDYDGWAAAGNTEWSFEKVLPAFRAIETDLDFGDTEFHGARGPIRVRRAPMDSLALSSQLFIDTVLAAGFKWDADVNGRSTGGLGRSPINAIDGVRQNAGAFIDRVIDRENLSLLDETLVRRVVIEKGAATGVEVIHKGAAKTLHASETILCAGGINSPHLLMLSGLGPASKLAKVGVKPICDLKHVGANLADHPYLIFPFAGNTREFHRDGKTERGVTLNYATDGDDNEDCRISAYAAPLNASSPDDRAKLGFTCSLGAPLSRGEIVLRSGSPEDSPIVEYNYLSEPEDRRRLRESVRLGAEIAESPEYKKRGAALTDVNQATLRDDAALDHWIATHLWTAYHSSGTCKMGPDSDETAVVDQYCRVRGVDGLRVVDISILPTIVTRGTHATAVMIGEHAATLLRRERRGQNRKDPVAEAEAAAK